MLTNYNRQNKYFRKGVALQLQLIVVRSKVSELILIFMAIPLTCFFFRGNENFKRKRFNLPFQYFPSDQIITDCGKKYQRRCEKYYITRTWIYDALLLFHTKQISQVPNIIPSFICWTSFSFVCLFVCFFESVEGKKIIGHGCNFFSFLGIYFTVWNIWMLKFAQFVKNVYRYSKIDIYSLIVWKICHVGHMILVQFTDQNGSLDFLVFKSLT